jgi:hypothetical protein
VYQQAAAPENVYRVVFRCLVFTSANSVMAAGRFLKKAISAANGHE